MMSVTMGTFPSVRRVVILVGVVFLIALGAVVVFDYTRTQDRIDAVAAALTAAGCTGEAGPPLNEVCDEIAESRRADLRGPWERRRAWYAFGAGAIVLATTALAFALPRRTA
jgi:hypothetical protein